MTDTHPAAVDLDGLAALAKAVIESKAAFMALPEAERSIGVPIWWKDHRAYADALTPETALALIALARRAVGGGGEGVLLRRAVYDWLRDDVPLAAKMVVMPEHVDALQARLATIRSPE